LSIHQIKRGKVKHITILITIITNILLCNLVLCQSDFHNKVAIEKLMNHAYENRLFNGVVLISTGDSIVFQRPYGYAVMEWDVLHTMDSKFSYHSIGYQMLASIIENRTNMSFEEAMKEMIFKPLNMTNSGIHNVYEQKKYYAYAYEKWYYDYNISEYYSPTHAMGQVGVYSTAGDLLKWNQAINSHTLLSDSMTIKMFTADPATQRYYEGYGYGWYVGYYEFEENNFKINYHQHSGGMPGHTSLITRLPGQDYYIVLLNNTGHAMLELINYEIIRVLFGFNWVMPKDLAVTLDQCHSIHLIDSIMNDFHSDEDKYMISDNDLGGLCYKKIRSGKDELAMAIYKSGLEYFPQSIKLNSLLAEAFFEEGEYGKAEKYYLEVLKVLPDNPLANQRINQIKISFIL
jgi:tetratricopeptide (TPR) repeat protein